MSLSTSHSQAALSRRLEELSKILTQKSPALLCFSKEEIAGRLLQRAAELWSFRLPRAYLEEYRLKGYMPTDNQEIKCRGISLNSDNQLRLSVGFFCSKLFEFFIYWTYAFLVILISLRITPKRRKIILLYGVPGEALNSGGSDERFLNFCRFGPINLLHGSNFLMVQSVGKVRSIDAHAVVYCRFPIIEALKRSGLNFRLHLFAICYHLYAALVFLLRLPLHPELILLSKDISFQSAAIVLDSQGLIKNIAFSNSNLSSQPLWSWALPNKKFDSHMIWYSQNSFPISYKDEQAAVIFPPLNYMKVDIHWVWSEGFKSFLESCCSARNINAVSSIVWHSPSINKISKTDGALRIVIFDVTPVNEQFELDHGLIRNFYSEKNMIWFIEDVMEVADLVKRRVDRTVDIAIKHKRENIAIHSAQYQTIISDFVQSGVITLVPHDCNIYDLIGDHDIVISPPYSSPVYIGKEMGKAAFWYDPTDTVDWKLGQPETPLIQGKEALHHKIKEILEL
tara:strand:+ start:3874 stop:5403 length:1530 start_codon:yes stop_codon:yes gene_type:complete